jgi:CBS domain-containing protein
MMKVKELMTSKVVTIGPTATIEQVADVLHQYHFTGIPVVDTTKRLLGVIMERDFITADSKLYLPTYIKMLKDLDFVQNDKKHLSKEAQGLMSATAKDVMNSNIVTASPEDSIEKLSELFATKRVNPIPVVDDGFHLVGVISRSDLIKLFSRKNIEPVRQEAPRIIDATVEKAYKEVGSHFAFVSKMRASIWFLISLAFLIIGFILGVAWVVDF